MKVIKQTILQKKYDLHVAISDKDKRIGMNRFKTKPKNQGILFQYGVEEPGRTFTLKKTPFDLIVIFLNNAGDIVHVEKGRARQRKLITCDKPSSRVIEIPA